MHDEKNHIQTTAFNLVPSRVPVSFCHFVTIASPGVKQENGKD